MKTSLPFVGGTAFIVLAACATQNRDVAAGNPSPISSGCTQDCSKIVAATCFAGVCNDLTGQCEVVPSADGTACDDGLFCTVGETCQQGVCGNGEPNPCGETDCLAGVCSEQARQCLLTPRKNGTQCNVQGDACAVGATCQSGECVGTPKDCSFAPGIDECHVGACDPATGACEIAPGNDGAPCHAQLSCAVDQTCWKGACQGGKSVNHGVYSTDKTACHESICNPIDGSTTDQAVPIGAACDLGNGSGFECVTGTCAQSGSCQPVVTVGASCASAEDDCSYGTCNPESFCGPSPTNEGAACDDRDSCTTGATCQQGSCKGSLKSGVTIYYKDDFGGGLAPWTTVLGAQSLWTVRQAVSIDHQQALAGGGGYAPEKDHTATMDQEMLVCADCPIGDSVQSPPIDTSGATGSVWLTVWSAIVTQSYEKTTVSVFDGTDWVDVWSTIYGETRDEWTWSAIAIDVTQYKNPMFRVRFGFEPGDPLAAISSPPSWFIDDVTVASDSCAPGTGTSGSGNGG
jgi:hypothetical protein